MVGLAAVNSRASRNCAGKDNVVGLTSVDLVGGSQPYDLTEGFTKQRIRVVAEFAGEPSI